MSVCKLSVSAIGCAITCATLVPSTAHAEPLLRVGGTEDAVQTIGVDEALSFSFTLPRAVTSLSISVSPNAACVRCSATAWLSRDIDSAFSASDLLAVSDLTVWNPRMFAGVALEAGTYYVTVRADAGSIVWPASLAPTVNGSPAVERESDWRTDDARSVGPSSDFSPLFGDDGSLHYLLVNEVCGDGSVDPQEQCDDGNTRSLDGCSNVCRTEVVEPTACGANGQRGNAPRRSRR